MNQTIVEEINCELQKIVLEIIKSDDRNINVSILYEVIERFVKCINNDIDTIIKLFIHKFLFPDVIQDYSDIRYQCNILYFYSNPLPLNRKIDWSKLSPNPHYYYQDIYNKEQIIKLNKLYIDENYNLLKQIYNRFDFDYNILL